VIQTDIKNTKTLMQRSRQQLMSTNSMTYIQQLCHLKTTQCIWIYIIRQWC